MSISSDEVNFLVYRYLQESGKEEGKKSMSGCNAKSFTVQSRRVTFINNKLLVFSVV